MTLSYRCYVVPIAAGLVFALLFVPLVQEILISWIPNYYYRILSCMLIIIAVTFCVCRIMDNWCELNHMRVDEDDW